MGKFTAQVRNWTEKAKRNAELVAKGSIQDVAELMTRRQPSVKDTGGAFEVGKVPVDEGTLINSQQVSLSGTVIGSGDVSHTALIAGMDLGDSYQAVFTADHARPMEYGFTTRAGTQVPGRFYVREAVQNWQAIVDANAALYGD